MKRLLTLALAVLPLFAMAQDDLYFNPAKKPKETKPRVTVTAPVQQQVVTENYGSCTRSEDDYNRRYSYSGDNQNAGGLYANDTTLTARIDTTWSNVDMEDPEIDYRYSRRLVRFHSPRYYSPYYWDLMYAYGAWDYLYDPYDPWYWHYGWGYGWSWGPWDCWYGGIWGWGHPYHWSYWGWGPGWNYGYWHPHVYFVGGNLGSSSYRPRGQYATVNGRGTGVRSRTNPNAYVGRGNSAATRSSGLRGSGVSARGNGNLSNYRGITSSPSRSSNARSNATSSRGFTDYTGGRTSTNHYGQRGTTTTSSNERYGSSQRSSARTPSSPQRSSTNSSSSSRASSSSSSSSRSYSSGSSSARSGGSYSSGGGSARSGGGSFGGGGGARSGGGGGRR